jgi:hypothetical protein
VTDELGDLDMPLEATFVDDVANMDLGAKVTEAWRDFTGTLAGVLATLPEGARIDLTLDPAASGADEALFGVSVRVAEDGHLQGHAVGNTTLPPEHRLGRAAVGELVALGWLPPKVLGDDDERLGLQLPVSDAGRLAAILCRTLREIYGTPHPAFLVYSVIPAEGQTVDLPALGAARQQPPGIDGPLLRGELDLATLPLSEQVSAVIAAMLKTTPENLPVDADGDIGIRSGSAMVFVRVRDNPPLVDVFSPVLTEVAANERLYTRLSELTHRMPIGRLYCNNATVWASVPVFGRDFQATHLMVAVQVMTGLADELDDRLHGEFGGKRFFVESDRSPADKNGQDDGGEEKGGREQGGRDKDTDDGTGFYL